MAIIWITDNKHQVLARMWSNRISRWWEFKTDKAKCDHTNTPAPEFYSRFTDDFQILEVITVSFVGEWTNRRGAM